MNIKEVPYNMKFIFGPNLREVPVSKIQMLNGMIYLKEQLDSDIQDEYEKGQLEGMLGFFLRIVGELEESEKYLHRAIQTFNNLNSPKNVFTNKLRLAHTYQWWTEFDISNEMYAELRETAETDREYSEFLDFVYHHCGMNLLDQKDFQGALNFFKKSLEIRLIKGNQELIESSETAIEACEYRIENKGEFE